MDKLNELIMLSRLGDQNALTELMTQYKGLVKSIASHYFVAGADLEDIIQEGSLGLYKAIISFDETKYDNFDAYASMIIKRQILNAVKSSNREKNQSLNNSISLEDENAYDIPSNNLTPEEKYASKQNVKDINVEMKDKLSAYEYSVYRLQLDGYKYDDIANILGVSPKSVDNALSRIKNKIKQIMGESR